MLLGVAGMLAWRWGPAGWKQFNLLRLQRACLSYAPPADQVVYEEEQHAAALLLREGDEFVGFSRPREVGPDLLLNRQIACRVPPCWRRFEAEMIPTATLWSFASNPLPVLFLGKRTSPKGHERLICVRYFPSQDAFPPQFLNGWDCDVIVMTPISWSTQAVIHPNAVPVPRRASGLSRAPLRIYAGQADPADPSHFTVSFVQEDESHVLDGWLRDNEDVVLVIRK
jgi:hypothetical protein